MHEIPLLKYAFQKCKFGFNLKPNYVINIKLIRHSLKMIKEFTKQILDFLKQGSIRLSRSPYSNPTLW